MQAKHIALIALTAVSASSAFAGSASVYAYTRNLADLDAQQPAATAVVATKQAAQVAVSTRLPSANAYVRDAEQVVPARSRAEVVAELEAAQRSGEAALIYGRAINASVENTALAAKPVVAPVAGK